MHMPTENKLFALARRGLRITHPILALVLSVVFAFGGVFSGAFLILALGAPTLPSGLQLAVTYAPIGALVILWVRGVEGRSVWTLGFTREAAGSRYLGGFALGLLLFLVPVGVATAFGLFTPEADPAPIPSLALLGAVLLVLPGWIVQSAAEELLTRGWLLQAIGARWRPWLGVLLSALLFALLHGLNSNFSPIAALNIALFGIFAALVALDEGGLWGVCGLHAAWNWSQGSLLGLAVSGSTMPGRTLIDLVERGPDQITGGAFGPEGGLLVTAALLIGCALFAFRLRRAAVRAEHSRRV